MKLERLRGPVRDPFMAAVRRRHADVDIVLLPPEAAGPPRPSEPSEPSGPPEAEPRTTAGGGPAPSVVPDPATARALAAELVRRVGATTDRLWGRAADDPAVLVRTRVDSLAAGPAVGSVRGRSRIVAESTDGVAVLSRLRAVLQERGWQVERTDGPVHRLTASRTGQSLRATHATGSGGLMLEVLSEAADVGPVVARRLLDDER